MQKLGKLILVLTVTLCSFNHSSSQVLNKRPLTKCSFSSIKEALKYPKDSILEFDFGNTELDTFPMIIFSFKKLEKISFHNENICKLYFIAPSSLSERDKEEAKVIFDKLGWDIWKSNILGFAPIYRKTIVNKIPKQIKSLKNLKVIIVDREFFSKRELRKLRRWLPNCYINVHPWCYKGRDGKFKCVGENIISNEKVKIVGW